MSSSMNHGISNGVSSLDQIRGIIFDFDNTLIATRQIDEAACNYMLNCLCEVAVPLQLAAEIILEFYRQYRAASKLNNAEQKEELGTWKHRVWNSVLNNFELGELTECVFDVWHSTRLTLMVLNNDIIELIKKLNKKYKLAVITNGESSAQWEKLRASGLPDLIPTVVVSGDTGLLKPQKEIFQKTLNLMQVLPHECMMVGDNPHTDIAGGLLCGMGATVQIPQLYAAGGAKTLPSKPKLNLPPLERDFVKRQAVAITDLSYDTQLEMYHLNFSYIYEEEKRLRMFRDGLIDLASTNDGSNILPNLFLKSVMDLDVLLNVS